MKFFRDLGSLVEGRWRDVNYDERAFPEIAAQALAETNPKDPWDIIRWLHTTPHLPSQQDVDGRFGNPPITLYCSPRFHIDVYFWLDGTTSIHQHAFSGAFQVLLGSSVHSQYSFEHQQHINSHFSVGQVCLNSAELLAEGDIRTIFPGRQFIHSLFHLDRPSATVTIRTYQNPDALPQYDFLKPCVALDSYFRDESTIKKIQSVVLLLAMEHPEADSFIGDLVSSSDFQTTISWATRKGPQQARPTCGLASHSLGGDSKAAKHNTSKGVYEDQRAPILPCAAIECAAQNEPARACEEAV